MTVSTAEEIINTE